MATADEEGLAKPKRPTPGWGAWLADPRTAVLGFLGTALLIGGGRKVWQGIQARRAVAALGASDVRPEEVEAAAEHGREGLIELFRLLGTAESPEVRNAAGRALAVLWARDDLIVEEEKALVRRGFAVTWKARRRYPRGLRVPIPIEASYGVPFLVDGGKGVGPSSLEWSHRILGAERAGLEEPSTWVKGPGLARFEVEPSDFATLGPHRLALAARVRVVGLTDNWEIELPHLPFSFEFDPILSVEALLATEDEPRKAAFARSIRLQVPEGGSRHLDLNAGLVLRDPPDLVVTTPLPCDLAHHMDVEFEGVTGRFRAGSAVVVQNSAGPKTPSKDLRSEVIDLEWESTSRKPTQDSGLGTQDSGVWIFPIGPIVGLPLDAIDRPGERRIRAVLTADPELGWADPDARSVWPGTLTSEWATVKVIRR
jgi:hypothetical protein